MDKGIDATSVDAASLSSVGHSNQSVPPKPGQHLRYLDGLRGIAILAVLLVHSSQLVTGLPSPVIDFAFYGVRGVQLFFIVSGLTLTMNYLGKPFHALNFAARRYFRIAPMFYAGALLYLLLVATTSVPLPTRAASGLDIIVTFLFLHGWVPSAVNTVVPGGWSIAAEAMFYVVFPAILVIARRRDRMVVFVVTSYVVAGATSLALRRWGGTIGWSDMSFPFWLVQLPAFAGGCWLATLPRDQTGRQLAAVCLAIGVIGLVIDSQLRGRSNLLVAIALLTLVTWAAGVFRPTILQGRILPLIGQISFSLYIVQFAVLAALHPLASRIEPGLGALGTLALVYAAALGVGGVISFCTYRWIERPFIRASRRLGLPS